MNPQTLLYIQSLLFRIILILFSIYIVFSIITEIANLFKPKKLSSPPIEKQQDIIIYSKNPKQIDRLMVKIDEIIKDQKSKSKKKSKKSKRKNIK